MSGGRLRGSVGVAWRYGIAESRAGGAADSIVQIVAFGTGIMVLLLLGIIRDDLNSDWRRSLPADLPNYFFVNIPPAEPRRLRAVPEGARRPDRPRPAHDPRAPDRYQRPARWRILQFAGERGEELRDPRAEPHLVRRARR